MSCIWLEDEEVGEGEENNEGVAAELIGGP